MQAYTHELVLVYTGMNKLHTHTHTEHTLIKSVTRSEEHTSELQSR